VRRRRAEKYTRGQTGDVHQPSRRNSPSHSCSVSFTTLPIIKPGEARAHPKIRKVQPPLPQNHRQPSPNLANLVFHAVCTPSRLTTSVPDVPLAQNFRFFHVPGPPFAKGVRLVALLLSPLTRSIYSPRQPPKPSAFGRPLSRFCANESQRLDVYSFDAPDTTCKSPIAAKLTFRDFAPGATLTRQKFSDSHIRFCTCLPYYSLIALRHSLHFDLCLDKIPPRHAARHAL
jgi:hypothetical protein